MVTMAKGEWAKNRSAAVTLLPYSSTLSLCNMIVGSNPGFIKGPSSEDYPLRQSSEPHPTQVTEIKGSPSA